MMFSRLHVRANRHSLSIVVASVFLFSTLRAQEVPAGAFVNGSFESPALAPDASVDLPPGSTTLTGWTVGNTGLVSWRNGPAYGVAPVDGSQEIGFNGADRPSGGSISQTFSTTIGQTYEVRFNVGRQGSGSGTMSLLTEVTLITGGVLSSLTAVAPNSPGYGPAQVFSFTATTANSRLTFTDTSTATIAVDILLDKVSVAPVSGCITPPASLVSWWPGQGDANDVVGGNDGTLQNGAAFVAGKVGEAFSFDGVNDHVSFGNTAGNFGTNDFTVDFWIRTTATRLESVIEKRPICGVSSMWNIRIGGPGPGSPFPGQLNTEMFSDASGNDHNVIISSRTINDGSFHHVALVRRGANIAYYIDGVLDVSSDSAGGVTRINNTADLMMGRSVCMGIDGTSPFTGQMDELSIYNRALSLNEIQAVYNAGSAGKCASPPPPARALAHWKFDETGGSTAHDSAGAYHGTLSVSGASFVPGGVSGGALSLNKASNGFVSMGNVLGLENTDYSIVAWIRMTAGDTTDSSVILSKNAAYTRNGYFLNVNKTGGLLVDNKAAFIEGGSGVGQITTAETPISTTSVNDGNWHQIVAVYQVGGVKAIYVDGSPAEDTKPSQPFNQNSVALLIGGVNFGGIPRGLLTGLIDDIQIYNFALNPAGVDFLFQNPGQAIPPHDVPPGQWRLTAIAGAGGTVTRDPDLANYTNGATVTVTALPNAGFVFAGWSGDASGTTNPITIRMNGNKTVTAGFQQIPARVLAVVNPDPRQEGRKISVPIELTSQGEVGGMSLVLRYDPAYLKDPDLDWSLTVGSALNQVNYDTPGEIRATFALPATAVPSGTRSVATVSFRARSVPFTLTTDLTLEILDVSRPTGDLITSGSFAQSGFARILVRRVIGDNNANDRLDVGDGTIIQRLLTGLDPVRSWDVTWNDVNANTRLDSGDAIRVLRVVADLDPQPTPQPAGGGGSSTASRSGLRKAGPAPETVVLSADKLRGHPGDLVTVQVRLQGISTTIAGASFTLNYPTNALRLINSQSQRTGELVPGSAVAIWNVAPAQNIYPVQNGRVSVALSSAVPWPTNSGVLAEFTFQVQSGQADQYCWPVSIGDVEITDNGYEVLALSDAQICFVGRDPLPPRLTSATAAVLPDGFELTLTGEVGLSYTIEVSIDLVTWTPLTTLTPANGTLNFSDPNGKNLGHRFYRAKHQ